MDSTVRVIFLGDAASAVRSVSALEGRMGSLGSTAARTGKILAGAVGISLIGGMAKATTLAIGFDRSMRNVNSIAKVSEKQFQALEKRVLGLSKATGQGPKVLADGLYDIVSSGFKANDAIRILAVSAKAATAGMTDTATASKAVVAVLNAYHLGAGQAKAVSDVLFQTVNKGVLTFSELSQQIGDVLPYASKLNVPLTDIGGALATLTLHGVNAAEAATQLKQVMASVIAPSKGLTAEIKRQGFESGQAMLSSKGFQGTIEALSKASGGNAKTLHDWFPNIRALSGFFGISGKNAKQLSDNIKSMTGASKGAGATSKAFAEQGKSISVQWDKAVGALSGAGVKLGTTLFPALATGIDYLTKFAGWLDKLAGEHSIRAKVEFVGQTAESFASHLRDLVSKALTGGAGGVQATRLQQPGAPVDLKYQRGLVETFQSKIIGMGGWDAVGKKVGAAIGAGIVISAAALDNLSKSLVTWANGPGGNQAGEVGATLALNIVAKLLDPVFWAQHWQLALGIAIAVLPVGRLATIGEKVAVLGFKTFGATVGRLVSAGLGRIPGVVGEFAPRFAGAVGRMIAAAGTNAAVGALALADLLVRTIARGFGRLGPLIRALLNTTIINELSGLASAAYGWGVRTGENLAHGVIAGLAGLPGKIASAINPFGGGSGPKPKVGPHAGAGKAAGDRIDRPMLSVIGEDAPRWPEWVIPSNPRYRDRALGLLSQATGALGLSGFARGGGPSRGGRALPPGHSVRKRTPVQAAFGAAQKAINELTSAQQRVSDLGRTYSQDERAQGAVNLPQQFFDVPDDPADPNGPSHQVVNPEWMTAAAAQVNALIDEKGGIIAALETERQRIEEAITAVQKAIEDLMAAIKVLNDKAKVEGKRARSEHSLATAATNSVSRKGGLQDQLATERAAKKPSKAKILQLQNAIKQAGRDHDDHEGAAKQAETNQGRYQKQAGDDAGKARDLRSTLAGLLTNRHDLPFDVRDQQIDVAYLRQALGQIQSTTGTAPGTPSAPAAGGGTTTTTVGPSTADDTSLLEGIIQRLTDALGLQGDQMGVLGAFPSFATGIDYIPNDMVAQLHRGESVLTAAETSARSGASAPTLIELHLSGALEALADMIDVRVVANTPAIVSKIGRSADTLRRSNMLA